MSGMATRARDQASVEDNLYETDLQAWFLEQASRLRDRDAAALEWDNIAEELEGLAGKDRREIVERFGRLNAHLLKLWITSDIDSRRGWWLTIAEQRLGIEIILDDSPSLRPRLAELFAKGWRNAAKQARLALLRPAEQAAVPDDPPWTADQAMSLETDEALRALCPR